MVSTALLEDLAYTEVSLLHREVVMTARLHRGNSGFVILQAGEGPEMEELTVHLQATDDGHMVFKPMRGRLTPEQVLKDQGEPIGTVNSTSDTLTWSSCSIGNRVLKARWHNGQNEIMAN